MTDKIPMSAYERQQERAEELYAKTSPSLTKVKELCEKHAELLNDFEVVKEINKVVSIRFDEVTQRFPLVSELDQLIAYIQRRLDDKIDNVPEGDRLLRLKVLKSFRTTCVALQKNSDQIRPKSYDESIKDGTMKQRSEDENHEIRVDQHD